MTIISFPDQRSFTYANLDAGYFPYEIIHECGFSHRGPLSVKDGAPVVAIGAAQTFGRFVEHPFTRQLADKYDIPTVNMGFSGPGPAVFEEFLSEINRHPCVVVQVMSGRSAETSFFKGIVAEKTIAVEDLRIPNLRVQKIFERFNEYSLDIGAPIPPDSILPAKAAWETALFCYDKARISQMISEVRAAYVEDMSRLLNGITGRKILLWISERPPRYEVNFDRVEGLFGGFPQLVNDTVVDKLVPLCDGFVECTTNRGMPMRLPPPLPGRAYPWHVPKGINHQYPSQEMHDDIASKLGPYLTRFLKTHGI